MLLNLETKRETKIEIGVNPTTISPKIQFKVNMKTSVMATLTRTSDDPYTVTYSSVDVHEVADRVKTVPLSWITPDETDVTEEMIRYLQPLIQGDPQTPVKDGLPDYLRMQK